MESRFIWQILALSAMCLIFVRPCRAASASFGPPQCIVTFSTYPDSTQFLLADINGDGRKDIVAFRNNVSSYGEGAYLSWYESNDQASFPEHGVNSLYGDWAKYGWIDTADMDKDGRLDIVAMRVATMHASDPITDVSIFRNLGGTQPAFQRFYAFDDQYPRNPGFVTDVNHDGHLDVVISTGWWLIAYNNNGLWPPSLTYSQLFNYGGASYVNPVDLDGDGDMDVVLAGPEGLRWREYNGSSNPLHAIDQGTNYPVTVVDINGDGRMDLLAGGRLYLNNRSGTPQFGSPVTLGDIGQTAAGDLSGTGNMEVVCVEGQWYSNPGGSSPVLVSHALTMPAYCPGFSKVAVGDVTGDGNPDIVARSGDKFYLYVNQSPARAVRVLAPLGGECLVAGKDSFTIHWKTDVPTAGTSLKLELWEGMSKVANLGTVTNATGEHTEVLRIPAITHNGWYRIRAVSVKNSGLFAFNEYPFVLMMRPNNVSHDNWLYYQ
ncbi:VCBS repeat-containing protein [bacterium]|nr:VCBS repeat-containing protein [bacterium]